MIRLFVSASIPPLKTLSRRVGREWEGNVLNTLLCLMFLLRAISDHGCPLNVEEGGEGGATKGRESLSTHTHEIIFFEYPAGWCGGHCWRF